jgi:hypothetical protein
MDWHPAPGKRFVGVRLGAVDCVDRTEIITSGTTSVVLHNCKYALVTRRRHEGDHGRQALQADCLRGVALVSRQIFGLEKWTVGVTAFDRPIGLLIMAACANNHSICFPLPTSKRIGLCR